MENPYEALGWIGNAVCLLGALRIAHQRRDGYILFALACCMIIPSVIWAKVWNQVGLETAYIVIDIYGWANWGKK